MTDTKITALSSIVASDLADGDQFVVVDVSDPTMNASGTTKRISKTELASLFQPTDSDLTAIAALSTTSYGRALLTLADAAAGRTALGVDAAGTAATAAAAAQAASQPLDSDLTAIAALSTTSYGRAFLELADAAAGRTALALGTIATQAASNVNISGGAITGITDLAIADGGTGASTAATALTNLGAASSSDPLGWGVPITSALLCGNMSVGSVAANNYNWFSRVIGAGTITKIGIVVGTQSGNICVGVVRPSAAGVSAVPVTRVATSGSVSCPATGYQEVALTGSVAVLPGDYFVLTADNTTATFQRGTLFSGSSSIFRGMNYVSSTDGFPIASTIAGASAAGDRCFAMVGVA